MATLRHRYQPPEDSSAGEDTLPLDTICTILTRQSTLAQKGRHLFSAEVDPQTLVAEARRLGYPPERILVLDWDMGKGAYNTTIEQRPALRHWLTELLPTGQSRVVLVSQEDRLFRDRTEIQVNRFIEQVAQHRGWVVCGPRVYNLRREMDKEQFRLVCKFGKQYIEFHLKQRLHPANQRSAMQGRYAGGMVAWGYRVDYDTHSPTYKHLLRYGPHAQLVTERVFTRFAGLVRPSVSALARSWWRDGVVWPFFAGEEVDIRQVRWYDSKCRRDEARGGYQFDPRQAQTILTNVIYLGWVARRGEVACDPASGEPRICHEPLVEADLFWWCYDRILSQRPPFAPPRIGPTVAPYHPRRSFAEPPGYVAFLAHGLVRCAQHGRRLAPFTIRDESRRSTFGQTNLRCWLTAGQQRDVAESEYTECPVVPAHVVETALCEDFVAQLRLDERDLEAVTRALAQTAQRREQQGGTEAVELLERQCAEQQRVFDRAKHLYLTAPDLQTYLVEDMRRAQQTLADLQARLAVARAAVSPSARAWDLAERAVGLAERIRATFLDWSRPAQARVIGLALDTAVLGRVDRHRLGLWVRWQGGSETRRELRRPNGHRREWTAEEDAVLQAHFHQLTLAALCVMLPGRALPAVKFRAYQLGLRRPRHGSFSDVAPCVVAGPPTPNDMAAYGFPVKDGAGGVSADSSADRFGSAA